MGFVVFRVGVIEPTLQLGFFAKRHGFAAL